MIKTFLFILFFAFNAIAQDTTSAQMKADYIEGTSTFKNYIVNSSAEQNANNITCTGSWINCTRTTTSNAIIQGKASFIFNTSTSGDKVTFASKPWNTNELKSTNCAATFDYSNGYDSNGLAVYKAYVTINGTKVSQDYTIQPANDRTTVRAVVSMPQIYFPCGDGTNLPLLTIEATSSTGAALYVDNVYYGKPRNITQVAQANYFGSLTYGFASSCLWTISSSGAAYTKAAADTDCPTPSVSGSITAPSTKIIAFNGSFAPGVYQVNLNTSLFQNATSGTQTCRLTTGTSTSSEWTNFIRDPATENYKTNLFFALNLTAPYSGNVELECKSNSSTNIQFINDSSAIQLRFDVYYFPTQSQTAISMLNSDYDWTPSSKTLTWNNIGSSSTQYWEKRDGINLCMRGTFTTGTPSASTASLTLPLPINSSALTTATQGQKLGEMFSPLNSTTFIYPGNGSSSEASQILFYDGSDTSKLYIAFRQSGNVFNKDNGSGIFSATRPATFEFCYPVQGWTFNQNAPLLVGGVTSGYLGNLRIEAAKIAYSGGTPSVSTSSSNWISSVTDLGTDGAMTINMTSGTWGQIPWCSCTPEINTGSFTGICNISNVTTPSTTVLRIQTRQQTSSNTDMDVHIICVGPR